MIERGLLKLRFLHRSIVLKTKTHCDILKRIKYDLLSVNSGDLYQI